MLDSVVETVKILEIYNISLTYCQIIVMSNNREENQLLRCGNFGRA